MKGQEWSQQQLPQGQKAGSNQVFFRTVSYHQHGCELWCTATVTSSCPQLGQTVPALRWASTQVHAAYCSPMTACMASEHLNWHAS